MMMCVDICPKVKAIVQEVIKFCDFIMKMYGYGYSAGHIKLFF